MAAPPADFSPDPAGPPASREPPFTGFRATLREALLPRGLFARAVLALVVLRTPVVWLTAWLGRGEPISVTAMYRPGGDIQYYELLGAIARGNLGEPNLFESAGQGLHPFPLGSMWLHALFFAAAGPWGILIADTLVTVAGYLALVILARACRLSLRAAVAFGGFVCGYLYIAFAPLTDRFGWMRDLFWGDRFPRPFLTEIYVVLSYAVLMRLWLARGSEPAAGKVSIAENEVSIAAGNASTAAGDNAKLPSSQADPFAPVAPTFGPSFWVFASLVFTLLVQSDIYSGFIIGVAYVVVVGALLLASPARRREMLRGSAVFTAVLLATIGLFVMQQRTMTPGLMVRWGAYPLSRLTALSWVRHIPLPGPILVALAALAVRAIARKRPAADLRVVTFWCLLALIAALELPVFFTLLGKGLYPYQVADRLRRVSMFATALIVLTGLSAVWPTLAIARKRWVDRALAAALLLGMSAGLGARALEDLRREDHTRSWYKLGPGVKYRGAFSELVRELDKPIYRRAVVLGTLDQQVHVHWQAFVGGRSFVPDGFVSIAPNEEMERRLVLFARAIGAPTDTFLEIVQASSHNGLVFVSKYAASSLHTLTPLADYTEPQRRRIAARDLFDAFGFEVPLSELARLRAEYEGDAFRDAPPRLDLVVLNNDERFGKLAPPSTEYDLVFDNAVFRLYARRGLLQ